MITKKKWEKWFREELFILFPQKYHRLKYISRKAVKNRYGLVTPREAIDEVYTTISNYCMGLDY